MYLERRIDGRIRQKHRELRNRTWSPSYRLDGQRTPPRYFDNLVGVLIS